MVEGRLHRLPSCSAHALDRRHRFDLRWSRVPLRHAQRPALAVERQGLPRKRDFAGQGGAVSGPPPRNRPGGTGRTGGGGCPLTDPLWRAMRDRRPGRFGGPPLRRSGMRWSRLYSFAPRVPGGMLLLLLQLLIIMSINGDNNFDQPAAPCVPHSQPHPGCCDGTPQSPARRGGREARDANSESRPAAAGIPPRLQGRDAGATQFSELQVWTRKYAVFSATIFGSKVRCGKGMLAARASSRAASRLLPQEEGGGPRCSGYSRCSLLF